MNQKSTWYLPVSLLIAVGWVALVWLLSSVPLPSPASRTDYSRSFPKRFDDHSAQEAKHASSVISGVEATANDSPAGVDESKQAGAAQLYRGNARGGQAREMIPEEVDRRIGIHDAAATETTADPTTYIVVQHGRQWMLQEATGEQQARRVGEAAAVTTDGKQTDEWAGAKHGRYRRTDELWMP